MLAVHAPAVTAVSGSMCLNRADTTVTVTSEYGDNLVVEVSFEPSCALVKQEIAAKLPTLAQRDITLMQNGSIMQDTDVIDTNSPVELQYKLAGGGNHFNIVKGYPGCCRFDCLCCECTLFATSAYLILALALRSCIVYSSVLIVDLHICMNYS
jgi:hypothetical protein